MPAAELTSYLERLYRAAGMSLGGSRTMAEAHVEADLRGIPGHGSRLVPGYLAKLASRALNPRPRMRVLHTSAGCLALEGDLAPGPLAARAAVSAAVLRARQHGTGLVTVSGAGHAGALGVHLTRAARLGLITVLAAQTSSASVALHGGTGRPVLGNSALAIAVPGPDSDEPVVVDMAMGSMSWGSLHARAGRPLPPGSAVGRDGRQVSDPAEAVALLPGGGVRGQALAVIVELLVGSLTAGSPLPEGREGRGLLCLALAPSRLGAAAALPSGVRAVSAAVREDGGRMPGDRAWAHRSDATAHGIPMDDDTLRALVDAGRPAVPAPARWTARS
ncbi:Ldh family oxidoreductase [Streptomyces sp. NPDC056672]|uniref:Ldh family oxidoreductase n=1 Tax=Streptomyces sp. NPDC056672 TaxID=3345906 RepID=UPI0036AABD0A